MRRCRKCGEPKHVNVHHDQRLCAAHKAIHDLAVIVEELARLLRLVGTKSERLRAALQPFVAEAKEKGDFNEASWNPDYHIEITVTVAEVRAGIAALRRGT